MVKEIMEKNMVYLISIIFIAVTTIIYFRVKKLDIEKFVYQEKKKTEKTRLEKEQVIKDTILNVLKSMIENDKYKGYIRRYWSESFYGASIEFAKGCEVRFPKLLDKHGAIYLHARGYGAFYSDCGSEEFINEMLKLIYLKPCLYHMDMDKHGTPEYNKLENEYEKAREDLPYFVKELVTNE